MIPTRLVHLGLPALMLAATAGLVAAPTATAQALPTYTCHNTLATPFGSVKGRECTASAGAPSSGHHTTMTFLMVNSGTGEKWVCKFVEASIVPDTSDIPYYEHNGRIYPYQDDLDRINRRGVDASTCDRLLA